MRTAIVTRILHGSALVRVLLGVIFLQSTASAAGPLLIAYGGFNETMAPLWIGVERGLFRKHGVDVAVLQTRTGQIMMTTLATGGAPLVWAAPSSAVSSSMLSCGVSGRMVTASGDVSTAPLRLMPGDLYLTPPRAVAHSNGCHECSGVFGKPARPNAA